MSQNTMVAICKHNHSGLLSWHSSTHFQIPITRAISTMQLRLGTYCNFGLASTTICDVDFPNYKWVNNDCRSRLKLETLDALMRVSLYDLPMDNMDRARNFDTWKSTKTHRALPLELDNNQMHHVRNPNKFRAPFYLHTLLQYSKTSYHFHIKYKTANIKLAFLTKCCKNVTSKSVVILKPFFTLKMHVHT